MCRKAEPREGRVGRVGDVGQRVEQRPVQVEKDGVEVDGFYSPMI